jgi:hypothetical protein
MHILDTVKYREDCKSVFGYFLDHIPSYGRAICCVSKFYCWNNQHEFGAPRAIVA